MNLAGIEEVVADKGYHSGAALVAMKEAAVRTYIPEKKQAGKRHWIGKKDQQQAVYANRQRVDFPDSQLTILTLQRYRQRGLPTQSLRVKTSGLSSLSVRQGNYKGFWPGRGLDFYGAGSNINP